MIKTRVSLFLNERDNEDGMNCEHCILQDICSQSERVPVVFDCEDNGYWTAIRVLDLGE